MFSREMFKVQILPFPTIELFIKKKKKVKVKHAGHIVVNIVTSMKQGSGGFGAVTSTTLSASSYVSFPHLYNSE